MAKKAYIGVDGVARKIKKGYIGILDKMVRFDGDMYYDSEGGYWVTDSFAYVKHKEKFSTAHVEFDGVLYKDLYVETYISNGQTFKYVYIPDTDINIEFSSDGDCTLYDPSWELDTGRTYSLKIYTGNLESVARKIKKAYIGIGGVARPCWSGGELAYYGTITALSGARSELAATSVGNYALFGGGVNVTTYSSVVDAYNKFLVRSIPTELSTTMFGLAATTVGDYAVFGGNESTLTVNAYNSALTRSVLSDLNSDYTGGCQYPAATTIGGYALFGGGYYYGSMKVNKKVTSYNTSLTKGTPTAFGTARQRLAATTIGNYALFGGGKNGSSTAYATVDAYNTSLTRSVPTALSSGRYSLAATMLGNYALFGGGAVRSNSLSGVVDAYDESLTRSTLTSLATVRQELAATTVEDFAIFAGGSAVGSGWYNSVDAYDASLTRTTQTNLNTARGRLAATTIGNYALFGGGYASSVVDAFTVA